DQRRDPGHAHRRPGHSGAGRDRGPPPPGPRAGPGRPDPPRAGPRWAARPTPGPLRPTPRPARRDHARPGDPPVTPALSEPAADAAIGAACPTLHPPPPRRRRAAAPPRPPPPGRAGPAAFADAAARDRLPHRLPGRAAQRRGRRP